ncbi:MAG: putative inorganic carbon (HCO3(-)) transporter [Sphingobacteriales bacterium]
MFLFFVVAILQTSFPLLLDATFSTRLALLSLTIFVYSVYLLIEEKGIRIKISLAHFLLLSFVILIGISAFWATSISLAFSELFRAILFISILFIACYNLQKDKFNTQVILIKAIELCFLFSFITFLYQCAQISNYSYESIVQVSGISGHKNLYSSLTFLTAIASFIGVKVFKGRWRSISLILFILQLLVIGFLRSRGVIVGMVVFSLCYLILLGCKNLKVSKRGVKLIGVFFVLVLSLFFFKVFPTIISNTILGETKNFEIEKISDFGTLNERVLVWDKTYKLIYEKPVLGVGAGNWKLHYTKLGVPDIYKVTDLNVIFQSPHNEYLKVLSELGILGFAIFLSFIVFVLLRLLFCLNESPLAPILFCGFMGFGTICFFSFPMGRVEHLTILALLFALALSFSKKDARQIKIRSKSIFALIAMLFLVITVASLFKVKSELYLTLMRKAYYQGNQLEVIRYADVSENIFTETDEFGVPISWYRANANVSSGNLSKADIDFKKALKISPYNYHVLNDLGSSCFLNGEIDKAEILYRKAIEINYRYDEPKFNLIVLLISQNRYIEALKMEDKLDKASDRRKELIKQIDKGLTKFQIK